MSLYISLKISHLNFKKGKSITELLKYKSEQSFMELERE